MSASTLGGGSGVFRYLVSPVVLIVPVVLIAALVGKGFYLSGIPSVYIAASACIYLILSSFYVILCQRNKNRAAYSVAGLTDGMLVIFFSAAFQCGITFSLLGFVIAIAGMMGAMSLAMPPSESLFARKIDLIVSSGVSVDELRKIIDSIQFPCVFMEKEDEGTERVIAYNSHFADDFGLDRKKIIGSSLESLLPLKAGMAQIQYGTEEWVVKRTVKGKQVLLMLTPAEKPSKPPKIEVFDAIDLPTGLYVEGFMKYKARSDIESVSRGKRRMSAALFKISFPSDATSGVSDDERAVACVIFGRIILQSIRVCDSAYKVGNDEVILFMPDTPTAGADIVISRVYDGLKRMSAIESPILTKALLDYVARDYVGGGDLMSYEKILEELSIALYRKNPDLAVGP
ncbi:MAG: hypothetical protein LBT23_00345 [Synergistaceae bacterium]|jgi:hypothetical protein|nr:hypothetical protein [Synergistaceae bacterium]